MTKLSRLLASLLLSTALSGCWGGAYDDPAAQYLQRTDTITLDAGNAKEVNAAVHVVDPWPPGSGNRRIPANGQRMTGAIERYEGNNAQSAKRQPGANAGSDSASTSSNLPDSSNSAAR